MGFQIAIDGPSGSGKSTVAKKLASKLGFIYVDTGAMYRGIAFFCIENNVDLQSEVEVNNALEQISLKIDYVNGSQHILLNKEDVTIKIRTQKVAKAASNVATYKNIRNKLVDMQRKLAAENNVIMDGRDIGTNVLKNADLKIYLDASSYTRALRRQKELKEMGVDSDVTNLKKEIDQRDHDDKTRELNPLTRAKDAVYLDSSNLGIDEVVNTIYNLFKK